MTAITTSTRVSGDAVRRARAAVLRMVGEIVGGMAAGFGLLARQLTRLPGLAGAGCATVAAWDAGGRAAGLAVLAVFLLLLDRRMP